ncbi:hypothetical protein OGAPHI_004443 [Ogataea philodendri]|uniref:Uncharacterized protein n=1 Tax=Ogataea philodendri TaxID=1378263 RepID=A0A9P8P7T3_9ASCO|nr:uncharacterized protein OGAPHI_004443 [Ogataea philodendri]KAH3666254.1 hypothetical protein OGAPHI_004443 [Ogataea philodendri]
MIPAGMDTRPQIIAVPHIAPVWREILKAAPPTNMIKTWKPAIIAAIARKYQLLKKCCVKSKLDRVILSLTFVIPSPSSSFRVRNRLKNCSQTKVLNVSEESLVLSWSVT